MKLSFAPGFPTILAAIAALTLTSAPTVHAQQGGVAIFDIDKAAGSLGVQEEVNVALQEIKDNLNQQLAAIQSKLQAEFDQMRSQVGPQPTPEQAQQLSNINGQLTQKLAQSRDEAEGKLTAKRFELVEAFRAQVKPIALEIAKSKGLSIIITPDASLFAWDEAVDITAEVTARMETILPKKPAATPAAAPAEAPAAASPAPTENP